MPPIDRQGQTANRYRYGNESMVRICPWIELNAQYIRSSFTLDGKQAAVVAIANSATA
jgi:hypothetical protein